MLLAIVLSPRLHAQTLRIYSEFQRVDPYGNILQIDRARNPREILSPAVARNAYFSFQVAVTAPPNTNYFLYVLTNPGDQFRVALYQEQFVQRNEQWIPDTLEPLRLPCFGTMPDAALGLPGQTTRVYLLDVWVPPETLVRRVRLEVLLKTGGWVVAPMEVRVVKARVPENSGSAAADIAGPLPAIEERADASAWGPVADFLSGVPENAGREFPTLRAIIRRNAAQDMALARSIESSRHPRAASLDILLSAGRALLGMWSNNPAFSDESGAEWYLRVRDLLLRSVD